MVNNSPVYVVALSDDPQDIDYVGAFLLNYYLTLNVNYYRFESDGITFWDDALVDPSLVIKYPFYPPTNTITYLLHKFFTVKGSWLGLEPLFKSMRKIWDVTKLNHLDGVVFSDREVRVIKLETIRQTYGESAIFIPRVSDLLFNSHEYFGHLKGYPFHTSMMNIWRVQQGDSSIEKWAILLAKLKVMFPDIKPAFSLKKDLSDPGDGIIEIHHLGETYSFSAPIGEWMHRNHDRDTPLFRFFTTEDAFLTHLTNEKERWKK